MNEQSIYAARTLAAGVLEIEAPLSLLSKNTFHRVTRSKPERDVMKVRIEIDCTPEEARRYMGLPDVTPIHETMLNHMREAPDNAAGFIDPKKLAKEWLPMSSKAMQQFQEAFWTGAGKPPPSKDET